MIFCIRVFGDDAFVVNLIQLLKPTCVFDGFLFIQKSLGIHLYSYVF
jgi:hypothetical protein